MLYLWLLHCGRLVDCWFALVRGVVASPSCLPLSFHRPAPRLRNLSPSSSLPAGFPIVSVFLPETRRTYKSNAADMDDDDAYRSFEHRRRETGSGQESRFPILQPQFTHPTRLAPTRDRYRSTQYGNFGHDDVEDDGPYIQDEGIEFDSFGMSI
jgi:hypothetical protein